MQQNKKQKTATKHKQHTDIEKRQNITELNRNKKHNQIQKLKQNTEKENQFFSYSVERGRYTQSIKLREKNLP